MKRLALCLLALSSLASAAPTVTAGLAFGGAAREGQWTAVRVEVDNPDAELKVEVRMEGDNATSVRDLVVPAGSRHAYWIPVRTARRMEFLATAGGRELLKQSFAAGSSRASELVLADGGQRLILVVSDAPIGLPENELWKSILVAPADLPDFSDAFDAFDAVVVRFPCPGLSDDVAEALRRWTLAGGVLAVCAGVDAKTARDSRLGGILPAEIEGVTETRSLREIHEGIATPAASFPVSNARPRPGAARAPFGATGPAGLGNVVFLGFDPVMRPIADWPGLPRMWKVQLPLRPNPIADGEVPEGSEVEKRQWAMQLRRQGTVEEDVRNREADARVQDACNNVALAGKTVSLGWFFALLVAYLVVIGPVDYFVLKAIRRQAWTWVTLPVAIVGFCGAAWAMSAQTRARDVHIVAVGTIDVWPDAVREDALYLVVAPLPGNQELVTNSADARLWPAIGKRRGGYDEDPEPFPEIAWGAHPTARRLPVGAWKPYPITATTDLPPGAFSVTESGGRFVLHVPALLRHCRLQAGPLSRDLGDLAPGAAIPTGAVPAAAPFEAGGFEEGAARWLSPLLHRIEGTASHPILTGWLDRPAASPVIGGGTPARALFLVRFHLEKAP
ncbi:MAG: hypothetical protein K8T20_15350 [Planctomycetes bacterium]|nr:hypothetical protein [Planctomycetota bacterium]